MKRFISLLIITIILSIPVFAQETAEVSPDLKYVTDKIEQGITVLEDKLKAPAEHVYQLLIKQAFLEGLFSVIIFIVFIILFPILLHKAIYAKSDSYIVWSVITGLFLIVSVCLLIQYGLQVLNPEYYAIKQLLEVFK